LYNAVIRTFEDTHIAVEKKDSLFRGDFGITPEDLARVNIEPEEMNYFDLQSMVNRLQASGIRAGKWLVDLAFKVSQPFAAAIIVLFGVPFAAFRRRGGLVLGFGLSLLVCFVYFGFIQVGKIMGYNGTIPAQVAAWSGNVIFGVLGLYLVLRVRK
jgi:lipopolysaccharide export system permease protein